VPLACTVEFMEYLVDFITDVPEGTPATEIDRRSRAEAERVGALAKEGRVLRVWRPKPEDGRWRATGLYRADSEAELNAILETLPLYPWMTIDVRALAAHPNDPASAVAAKAPPTITTSDGTVIYYKDWGYGRPVVFSHGWPLNSDAWDDQLFHVASNGFRAIAHDRRGHGRSSQPWNGNDLDTYADDLAVLLEALDLHDVVLVGHSTGGGEVARYIGRHGNERVAKAVLVGAITPLMLKTAANPKGTPIEVFDGLRAGLLADRSQFFADLARPFYGANREGSNVSDGVLREFWRLGMMAGLKAAHDCIKAFSESDLTEDLESIDVPTLLVHGNDDQLVPLEDSAMLAKELVADAELKVYPGAPHGLMTTHKGRFNADLLAFIAC